MHPFKPAALARAAFLLSLPLQALAHEGHGQGASGHGHATDLLGLALGLVAAVMIWQSTRGE